MVDQFTRLRDGDPFWSEGRQGIPASELKALWDTKLSDVILRNTDLSAVQKDIFTAMDRIPGTMGDDTLAGGTGRDFLFGSDGADSLAGRAGGDDLQGGRGRDTLAGNQGDDCLNGGAGRDYLNGGSGEDFIFGGTGKDHLTGGQDNDELSGGRGMDRLSGNQGNDTLDGGLHADTLTGGTGNDLLTGGAGDDRFLFKTRHHGDDTITDFELGLDEIKVTGPMRRALHIEDTEGGLKFSDGANWSVVLEGISMGDWFQSGDSLF